jgi:hypothetical protein
LPWRIKCGIVKDTQKRIARSSENSVISEFKLEPNNLLIISILFTVPMAQGTGFGMKKFTTGSLLISSCLFLAGAETAAQAHAIQATTTSAIHARSTQPIISPSTKTITTATSNNTLGGIVSTSSIQHASLIGSSKVTKTVATTTTKTTTASPAKTTTTSTTSGDQAGTTSVTTVPTSTTTAQQQITAVIDNDWASWTGSSTGKLTLAEVGKLLTNPNITGSQAAVLGMIAAQMNADIGNSSSLNASPSYTQAQALAYLTGTNTSSTALFANNNVFAGLQYYITAMQQIASSTNSNGTFNLYGSYNGPQLTGIQQQTPGDCFFLSAVESVLNQNPSLVAKMITENSNGTFAVSFPNGQKETVTLTDADIATFSTATNNGCWLSVLGLAENNILVGLAASSNKTIAQEYAITAQEAATPMGVISEGGYPTQTLSLLTGKSYSILDNSYWQQLLNVRYVDQLLATDMSTKTPIGVESTDHALAIIGFNSADDMVTILNPWGVTASYGAASDPGVLNPWMNVQMVNGVFTISTVQMLEDFSSITATTTLLSSNLGSAGRSGTSASSGLTGAFTANTNLANTLSPPVVPTTPPQLSAALTNSSLLGRNLNSSNLNSLSINNNSNLLTSNADATPLTSTDNVITVSYAPAVATALQAKQLACQIKTNTGTKDAESTYEAGQGTLLVMHDSPVTVHTQRATVTIAAHAAGLIMQVGDEVAVSNLRDKHTGDISVMLGDKRIDVPQGRVILLGASEANEPAAIKLSACLDNPQTVSLGKFNQTSAFLGRMSYIFAVRNCPQLAELTYSDVPSERKAAMNVMRAAAAVITIAQGK